MRKITKATAIIAVRLPDNTHTIADKETPIIFIILFFDSNTQGRGINT